MRIAVTGAAGFVGDALVRRLVADGHVLRAAARNPGCLPVQRAPYFVCDLANPNADWRPFLDGADTVVHTAARVHVFHDRATDPFLEFHKVNVAGTRRLAEQAAAVGVRRFLYLSSIKVNGERTLPGSPFRTDDGPAPVGPYAVSKYEAERSLMALSKQTPMQVIIIRPALVYGPGVQGNFLTMLRWLHWGLPLPLASVRNRRSLVALDNLVDVIVRCVNYGTAGNRILLVSDGSDLSTPELLLRTAAALNTRPRASPR